MLTPDQRTFVLKVKRTGHGQPDAPDVTVQRFTQERLFNAALDAIRADLVGDYSTEHTLKIYLWSRRIDADDNDPRSWIGDDLDAYRKHIRTLRRLDARYSEATEARVLVHSHKETLHEITDWRLSRVELYPATDGA